VGRRATGGAMILVTSLSMSGCGSSSTAAASSTASSLKMTAKDVAAGKLDALPSGNVFVRVIHFTQAPGTSFGSEKHNQGVLFQAGGQQTLHVETDPPVVLQAGAGVFQPSRYHTHANTGTDPNEWYFFAIWPSVQRGTPLVNPAAVVLYATPDLPGGALEAGSYTESIRLVTIDAGGRTGAAKYGGLLTIHVLDGSVQVHAAGQQVATLDKGQATHELPGAAVQVFNNQNAPSKVVLFLATGSGQAFETPINETP
jgi:quercetin dioxygenase-like cupin family protein